MSSYNDANKKDVPEPRSSAESYLNKSILKPTVTVIKGSSSLPNHTMKPTVTVIKGLSSLPQCKPKSIVTGIKGTPKLDSITSGIAKNPTSTPIVTVIKGTPKARSPVTVIKGPPSSPSPVILQHVSPQVTVVKGDASTSNYTSSDFVAASKPASTKPLLNSDRWPISPSGKPLEPEAWECCGSDCTNCVWNQYDDQMEKWRKERENQQS